MSCTCRPCRGRRECLSPILSRPHHETGSFPSDLSRCVASLQGLIVCGICAHRALHILWQGSCSRALHQYKPLHRLRRRMCEWVPPTAVPPSATALVVKAQSLRTEGKVKHEDLRLPATDSKAQQPWQSMRRESAMPKVR